VEDVIRLANGGLIPVLEYVQREVQEALSGDPAVVVLDLSAQETVTSTAVAALLWVKRVCSARAVSVVLRSPSPAWIDLLRRADLLHVAEAEGPPREADSALVWPPLTIASPCGTK
jgi:anti-anti-sigma regulatory factor